MNLLIQDPSFHAGFSMHETLLACCATMRYGAGVYAFVTNGGVNLLLCDEVFKDYVKSNKGTFELIVGIDEITNTRTLLKLNELQSKYGSSLNVYVMMNSNSNTTFHPKFTWFKNEVGGTLIIGSNNLTEKGLRRNIEAFTKIDLTSKEIQNVEEYYKEWIESNRGNLFRTTDDIVVKKAKENERVAKKRNQIEKEARSDSSGEVQKEIDTSIVIEEQKIDEEDFRAWLFSETNNVLVAQIPKSGNRWKQANFDKNTFENFFGAQAGVNGYHRILVRNVGDTGILGDVETRPSVSVASQNYRFELKVDSTLDYPTTGRPIAVFINVATRMFLYTVVLPEDKSYYELDAFISKYKGSKMVRHITNVKELKASCPDLSLWKI